MGNKFAISALIGGTGLTVMAMMYIFDMGLQIPLAIGLCINGFLVALFSTIDSIAGKIAKWGLTSSLVALVVGVFLLYDINQRPSKYKVIEEDIHVTEGKNITLIESRLLEVSTPKGDVLYDEDNPLTLYEEYVIDIFGYYQDLDYVVKSNLMDEYVKVSFVKKQ